MLPPVGGTCSYVDVRGTSGAVPRYGSLVLGVNKLFRFKTLSLFVSAVHYLAKVFI